MSKKPAETIRAETKAILTRNAGRIPERLEADLDQILEAINAIFQQCLPAERVNQNETEQPYAAGQANGWNDAIQVIKRNFKRRLG